MGVLAEFPGNPDRIGQAIEIVEMRERASTKPVRNVLPGIIQGINTDDGTINIVYAGGILVRVCRRAPETKHSPITWQWPGADEPPDPEPPKPKRSA